jgi:hypothetical protein
MVMKDWLRFVFTRCLIVVWSVLSLGLLLPQPAIATIRQLEETPGQMVYQSRQTLTDQRGGSWQAIAFKRIRINGDESLYLRLVGFPGKVEIDRSLPLSLSNSLGKTLTAADASSQIFTDESAPEPQVGQYDIQPIVSQLQAELPWQLAIPTLDQSSVQLKVPSMLIQEWHSIAETHES